MLNFAVIGLGGRGTDHVRLLSQCNGAQVVALCDVYQDRIDRANSYLVNNWGMPAAKGYTDYKECLAHPGLDGCIVATSWQTHSEIAIYAMKQGVAVGSEVGCEYSLERCRELVNVHRETGTPYMFLENCCYGEEELICTSAVRRGLLGSISFCSGSYTHDLRDEITDGHRNRHYRFDNFACRNCDNYPTHELGPIARILNINRGNRIVSVTSMGSPSYGLKEYIASRSDADDDMRNTDWHQSDVVETLIKCENGELIRLHLNNTLPSFYSRGLNIEGTHGFYRMDNRAFFIENGDFPWHDGNDTSHPEIVPKIWAEVTDEMRRAGHGGMDIFVDQAFVDAIANKTEMPIDVYDGVTWMAISVLSEMSIKQGGTVQYMPDFTDGAWMTRKPKDVIDIEF